MKKSALYLGEFKQYDKVFITSGNGIDVEKVTSVAFEGETLYVLCNGNVFEYCDKKVKKLSVKASALFS